MKTVVVDKIASVAQHNDLGHELRVSPDIPCEEGVLVAVRVLNNKSRYNQLELTSGRMATVNQGDVAGDVGEIERLFDRGIAAADHHDTLVAIEKPVTGCTCRHTKTLEFVF